MLQGQSTGRAGSQLRFGIRGPRTLDPGLRPDSRTRDSGLGIQDSRFRTSDKGLGIAALSDRLQPALELFHLAGMRVRQVLPLARIPRKVLELRHGVVSELGVGLLVSLRPLARFD